MSNIIEFLTSKEVLIVYIIATIALGVALVIYIFEKTTGRRKRKQNTEELNQLVEDVDREMMKEMNATETLIEPVIQEQKQAVGESIPKTDMFVHDAEFYPEIEQMELVENIEFIEEIVPPMVPKTPSVENGVLLKEENIIEHELPIKPSEIKTETVSQIIEEDNKQVEEIIEYGSTEPDQMTAQAELEKLTEELKQKEEVSKNIELTDFELKQEEEAIISLEELMAKSNTLYEANEQTQYAEEEDLPISIQDLEARMQQIRQDAVALDVKQDEMDEPIIEPIIENIEEMQANTEVISIIKNINTIEKREELLDSKEMMESNVQKKVKLDDFHTIEQKTTYPKATSFKSSPIISPIYGIEKPNTTPTELELENTANYPKLDEEIRKTNAFLMTLKELQQKLD